MKARPFIFGCASARVRATSHAVQTRTHSMSSSVLNCTAHFHLSCPVCPSTSSAITPPPAQPTALTTIPPNPSPQPTSPTTGTSPSHLGLLPLSLSCSSHRPSGPSHPAPPRVPAHPVHHPSRPRTLGCLRPPLSSCSSASHCAIMSNTSDSCNTTTSRLSSGLIKGASPALSPSDSCTGCRDEALCLHVNASIIELHQMTCTKKASAKQQLN